MTRYVWHLELGIRADNAERAYEEAATLLAALAQGDFRALAKNGGLIIIGIEVQMRSWPADMATLEQASEQLGGGQK